MTTEEGPYLFENQNFEKMLKTFKLYTWINQPRNLAWKKPTDFVG